MATRLLIAFLVAASGIFLILLGAFLHLWIRYRGSRVVECPETRRPAGVELDSLHAATTGLFSEPSLRLNDCSRWPKRKNCGQDCLEQIAETPEDCLVRNILVSWYAGKKCAFCGKSFGEIQWTAHKPALLSPRGRTLEWQQIRAEDIPAALKSHRPVCWDCHIAETFRRLHPDLVVDDPGAPAERPRARRGGA